MAVSMSADAGHRWFWPMINAVVMVGGLSLFLTTAIVKFGDEAKRERLQAEGMPVLATVVGGTPETQVNKATEISYELGGRTYTRMISGFFPTKTVMVFVDAKDPSAFVAENGRTDQSRHPFNTWAGMPWGIAVATVGLLFFRKRRKLAKAGRPGASAGPAKPIRLDKRGKSPRKG
ncbi:hypothetical protein [Actinoplanes flavus]|uniref:DUF3592 domain-containing protein n=1 Tax=Actinoplanes flavus TaxID=2820290 RepID=A0ABS3V006_9ACTN|nr:hypothetical protein [Actinoplanes flavus]MBO3744163.1 hypothetical protein [Actinoplanes flavus]